MNQNVRIADFTRRQVRAREQLYEPHNSNWDYLITISLAFCCAVIILGLGIIGWVFWDLVSWP